MLFMMDGLGPRDGLFAMAQRLANSGYDVLMPDLYYRQFPYDPFDPETVFQGGDELDRLRNFARGLSNAELRRDIPAYAAALGDGPIGAIGYCLGARAAFVAAGCLPERVRAAALIHGSGLAPEADDGPHRAAPRMTARVYVGIAGIDHGFSAEEEGRLACALRAARVDHTLETYAGVHHGFAVDGMPVFDAPAAARHWDRVLALFRETLKEGSQ